MTSADGAPHYHAMIVQPWDIVDTWPIEQQIGMHRGNALTYLMRIGYKEDDLTQARKALHTVQKLIEVLEGKSDPA